jgi:LysR family transcriptional regulator, nitrogen assimilation regulatory protein
LNLKQLEYFVRVADLGSFTRAAAALDIAQPALSRQVRQLEVELRQTLLLRNGRGASPTEAGKLLLAHSRGILHQVALAKEELGTVRGALAGRVSIGLPPSLSKLITVPLMREFRKRLPEAQLSLTEGFSVTMSDGLRAGRIDMVVLYNAPPSPDIEIEIMHEEALVLFSARAERAKGSARSHPMAATLKAQMTLQAVAALPLIIPSRPNAFRLLIETEMLRVGCKPNIVAEIDGLNSILDLVREGMGFAVLPPYALKNLHGPHPFVTHRIVRPKLLSQLMLAWSSQRPSTETHRVAKEITRNAVLAAVNS